MSSEGAQMAPARDMLVLGLTLLTCFCCSVVVIGDGATDMEARPPAVRGALGMTNKSSGFA